MHYEVLGALEGDGSEVGHGGIATSEKTAELTTAVPVDQKAERRVEYTCDAGPDNDKEDSSTDRKSSDGHTIVGCSTRVFFFVEIIFIYYPYLLSASRNTSTPRYEMKRGEAVFFPI